MFYLVQSVSPLTLRTSNRESRSNQQSSSNTNANNNAARNSGNENSNSNNNNNNDNANEDSPGYRASANYLKGQNGSLRPMIGNTENKNNDTSSSTQSFDATRNYDKLLIVFDNQCVNNRHDIQEYLDELMSLYSCLYVDNNRHTNIYQNAYVDEWHAFLLIDSNNNNNNNNDCLSQHSINYDDFCISYFDYEMLFYYNKIRNRLDCISDATISSDPHSSVDRWHLNSIDGITDTTYTHVDTLSAIPDIEVSIFILDTGIRSTHYEFSANTLISLDDTFTDDDITDGHGTHVAGLAAGQSVGVAKGVTIYDYPVCRGEDGACGYQDINDGYLAVITKLNVLNSNNTNNNNNNKEHRGVINLSFGTSGSSTLPDWYKTGVDDDLAEIINAGGVIVAAAGNDGTNDCGYPAASIYSISVGAHLESGDIASFSNYGTCVDIYAPGYKLLSAWMNSDTSYALASGTSQATPIISGIITNMLAINSLLTVNEIKNILTDNHNTFELTTCPNSNDDTDDDITDETRGVINDNVCKAISIECNHMVNSILIPTSEPTNMPTVIPTVPYTYCCNPTQSLYTSYCWPIGTKNECRNERRICEWKSNNCKFNFQCTTRGQSCSSNHECCSKACTISRQSKTCA